MDGVEHTFKEASSEPPKLDLESYISNYGGRTRLTRLLTIGLTSKYLGVDALHMGIEEAKAGSDINMHNAFLEALKRVAPEDPMAEEDTAWLEKKKKQIKSETDRLEQELKGYKNNLIKESIRMGNEDLGRHYYRIGELNESYKSYQRMRDYCTNPKHIADMYLRTVLVAIAQGQSMSALATVQKVETLQISPEESQQLVPVLRALSGLLLMVGGQHYREAAAEFLDCSFSFVNAEEASGISWQHEVLTGNDVAVYGGLCALASMDRNELQHGVLNNPEFRQFLELEPHVRRMVSLFCSSKYSACLEILEDYSRDWSLDLHLQPILPTLKSMIRSKCIVQYFIPYSVVTLDEMAAAFAQKGQPIEVELEGMIRRGYLDARIDLVDRLLISPTTNDRHTTHAQALETAKDYEHQLRVRLLRMNMVSLDLELKQPKQQGGGMHPWSGGGGGDMNMTPDSDYIPDQGSRGKKGVWGKMTSYS